MKYPASCPLFEVLTDGEWIPRGAIAEGCELFEEWNVCNIGLWWPARRRITGPSAWAVHYSNLRPLTPAAREMLAIARGQ